MAEHSRSPRWGVPFRTDYLGADERPTYSASPESIEQFYIDRPRSMQLKESRANGKARKESRKRGLTYEPRDARRSRQDKYTTWAGNGVQLCGIPLKNGEGVCRKPAMGNGRCPMHGGYRYPDVPMARPKGRHGLMGVYSCWYSDDELDVYGSLKIGTLEEEIKLMRMQLRRALILQHAWEKIHAGQAADIETDEGIRIPVDMQQFFELDEYKRETEDGLREGKTVEIDKRYITRRKNDYKKEIHNTVRLLAELESVHKSLIDEKLTSGEMIAKISLDLRKFSEEAAGTTPGLDGRDEADDDDDVENGIGDADVPMEEAPEA